MFRITVMAIMEIIATGIMAGRQHRRRTMRSRRQIIRRARLTKIVRPGGVVMALQPEKMAFAEGSVKRKT